MATKGKVHSTTAQVIRINDLLTQHLTREGDYVYYAQGWDDHRVAKEVATLDNPITASHVSNVRRELFGNFKVPERSETQRETRLGLLEREVRDLRAQFASLAVLHEKLCQNLTLNKVLDVRHLSKITLATPVHAASNSEQRQ